MTDRYSAALTASYVSDGLGQLLSAVVDLTTGAAVSRCSWAVEPGEYRWLFTRPGELVVVQIVGFADAEDFQPDAAGKIILELAVPLPVLAANLVTAFETHPQAHGERRYVENWGHPYPRAQLSTLREFITGTAS